MVDRLSVEVRGLWVRGEGRYSLTHPVSQNYRRMSTSLESIATVVAAKILLASALKRGDALIAFLFVAP